MSKTARVIAASNRAAAGLYADTTGPIIVGWLREHGYDVPDPIVVSDGESVGEQLRAAVDAAVSVVITTGGTGINPNDRTPEVTAAVLDHPVPGLADAVRFAGYPQIPTAVLSRGIAGVSGRTLIVNLPGSRGGVRDGLQVLDGVLEHAVDQLHGGDHAGSSTSEHGADYEHGDEHDRDAQRSPTAAQEPVMSTVDASELVTAEVSEEAISAAELELSVRHAAAGAVVTFSGVVRDHDGGRGVRELEYVSHPTAQQVINEVAAEVAGRFDGVRALAVQHRIGLLAIGDVALACAVSADHRGSAFEVCAELVDEVKRRLPIWKRQVFTDGTEEWVNCP